MCDVFIFYGRCQGDPLVTFASDVEHYCVLLKKLLTIKGIDYSKSLSDNSFKIKLHDKDDYRCMLDILDVVHFDIVDNNGDSLLKQQVIKAYDELHKKSYY